MKYYPHFIFLLLSFAFTPFLYAEPGESDARYLSITKAYTLQQDGSLQYEYMHRLRYDSWFSIHRRYGETNIIYDPDFQNININFTFTENPGGKKIPIPDNAKVEILPYMAQDAPFYNRLRQMTVVHTALEPGSVATVSYTLNTKAGFNPYFSGTERILQSSPADEIIIIIRVPGDKNFTFTLYNSDVQPVVRKAGNVKEYTWIFNGLEAFRQEANQQHPSNFEPYLQFSTAPLKDVYYKFIEQPAFKYNLTPSMEKWVEEIFAQSKDQLDFILNLQKKTANEFRTYEIPLKMKGNALQTAADVFANSGGTRLEKAIFMVSCLQFKGIKAFPVLSTYSMLANEMIGDLNVFENALVRLNANSDEYVYLPVDRIPSNNLRYSIQDQTLLAIYTGINIFELQKENSSNQIDVIGNINLLNQKGKKSLIQLEATNNAVPFFSMRNNLDQEVYRYFNSLGKMNQADGNAKKCLFSRLFNKGGNKVLEFSEHTLKADLKLSVLPQSLTAQSSLILYRLPESNYGFSSFHLQPLSMQRSTPLMLPAAINESYDYEIRIPGKYRFENNSFSKEYKFNFGQLTYKIKSKKRKLMVAKTIYLEKTIIAPGQYADFMEMVNFWNSQEANSIIIKKIK